MLGKLWSSCDSCRAIGCTQGHTMMIAAWQQGVCSYRPRRATGRLRDRHLRQVVHPCPLSCHLYAAKPALHGMAANHSPPPPPPPPKPAFLPDLMPTPAPCCGRQALFPHYHDSPLSRLSAPSPSLPVTLCQAPSQHMHTAHSPPCQKRPNIPAACHTATCQAPPGAETAAAPCGCCCRPSSCCCGCCPCCCCQCCCSLQQQAG